VRRLVLSFRTSDGRTRNFFIQDVIENPDANAVKELMQAMIGSFVPSDWQVDRAAVINTDTNELFDLLQ